MATKELITAERLRELLHYDPETGIFIWIKRTSNRIKVGEHAGHRRADGYLDIKIDNIRYIASRLAWLWMTGKFPEHEVDHEDLDRSNNRWINLREATRSQNECNKGLRSDNISGVKGVSWREDRKKWAVRIKIGNKNKYVGLFRTIEEAQSAYRKEATEHFGEFARFA